jgi:hypothetical protein
LLLDIFESGLLGFSEDFQNSIVEKGRARKEILLDLELTPHLKKGTEKIRALVGSLADSSST